MMLFISTVSFLWLVRTMKVVLFWIYLWQLKNYHIGRFIDHFKTHKGKKIFLNYLFAIKLILIVTFFWFSFTAYIILIIYFIESLFFLWAMIRRRVKKPVSTAKTIFLITVASAKVIVYLWFLEYMVSVPEKFVFYLLVFDILSPLIISLIVLFFQPFFVFLRNRILEKARKKMAQFNDLVVVGITGSYGKTSTKEFLTTILSKKFKVVATTDHQNSEIGIAQTILQKVSDKHQVFLVEMGAYNRGGIKLLCDIVRPQIGVVTGVNEQHLATFGSLDNLLSAEGGHELAKQLPTNGMLVVNGDNKYCLDLYKKTSGHKKMYAVKKDTVATDIWTEEVTIHPRSLDFMVMTKEGEVAHIDVNISGGQHIQNLLAAFLVAKDLGMSLVEIAVAVQKIRPEQAGMMLKEGIHGIEIINASYSSNSDGVMADLDYLHIFPGKKVVVMPCLIELGAKSKEVHYEIGKKIAEVCNLAIITTHDAFESLKSGATQNGFAPDDIIFCEKPKEIVDRITTFCKKGDTILLEGRVPSELITMLKVKK